MTLAYSYPLLGVFWSMMFFFVWVIWLMTIFYVIADIFRSHDMGGLAKAGWLIFVIFLPFLGVFVYLLARGDKMATHHINRLQAEDQAMQSYIQKAGTSSTGQDLKDLAELHSSGAITDAEFAAAKAKILA